MAGRVGERPDHLRHGYWRCLGGSSAGMFANERIFLTTASTTTMRSAKVTPKSEPFEMLSADPQPTLVLEDVTRDEANGISVEAVPQTWQVIGSMGGPQKPPRGADARAR